MMHKAMNKGQHAEYVDRMYQRMIGREEIEQKFKTIERLVREGK